MNAADARIASVDCAGVVVVAVERSEDAALLRLAGVGRADVVVVADDRRKDALAGDWIA
jgi:hypothetical protein